MPTYEYECASCGVYDVEQRITSPALTACAKCGKPVRRLISRSSFALRGGGWYADGYASGGGAKTSSPAAPSSPASPSAAPSSPASGALQKAG